MDAKVTLSPEELELVQNAGWLLTKNRIIDKVYHLFGDHALWLQQRTAGGAIRLPEEIAASSPKISRGENYKGLPWVMLDYPRLFGKPDTYALRTMFWWGHFISVTLHLKGKYRNRFVTRIAEQLPAAAQYDLSICIGQDEWRHDFGTDNYLPVNEVGKAAIAEILSAKEFCKLSARISLKQWHEAKAWLQEIYGVFFMLTAD